MIILGDPQWRRNDDQACELRFVVDGTEVAVVHGNDDLRVKFQVQRRAIGANTFSVNLSGPVNSGLGLLPAKGNVALWVRLSDAENPVCMATGQIDYFSRDIANGRIAIEIHARSTMAQLIDRPWNILYKGSLEDLLRNVADGIVKLDVQGLAGRNVRAYVDTTSAFAALRLLGVSLGFVIEEDYDGNGIPCKSIQISREEWLSKKASTISEQDIISLSETHGRPIKKRDER